MGEMTFVAANKVLETLDEKLSGAALKKQFKTILDRLEKNCEPTKKTKVSTNKLDDVKVIVNYLNQQAGTSYRATSKKTQSLIRARFDENFTIDDFKLVIDIKVEEWLGTEFQMYIRPETLFGTKFESYLNQQLVKPKAITEKSVPSWSNSEYKNETSTEDLARFERNSQERRKRLEKLKSRPTPVGSRTPDWYDPDYKNETTDKQQAELDRIKRQALEKMK